MATKGSRSDIGLLLLRTIAPAFLMITHGWAKLLNFSAMVADFPNPLGIGSKLSLAGTIGAEFFFSLLVVLGIATRLTALPPLFTMCVAAFMIHAGMPFQKKELAFLYGIIFLVLAFTGGGKYSLGNKFPKLRKFT